MTDNKVPDFEEIYKIVEVIKNLNSRVQALKVEIDVEEAEIVKKVSMDRTLSPDGKYLSVTFINATYRVTGINGELIPKRKELARLTAELDKAQKVFEVSKMQFESWRTEQANNRKSSF